MSVPIAAAAKLPARRPFRLRRTARVPLGRLISLSALGSLRLSWRLIVISDLQFVSDASGNTKPAFPAGSAPGVRRAKILAGERWVRGVCGPSRERKLATVPTSAPIQEGNNLF